MMAHRGLLQGMVLYNNVKLRRKQWLNVVEVLLLLDMIFLSTPLLTTKKKVLHKTF